jgi:hypothetical protein
MFFWTSDAVTSMEFAKSETLWSRQVEFYVPQVLYYVRQAYQDCDPIWAAQAIEKGKTAVHFMEDLQDELLYGNDDRNVRAGLQHSPAIAYLFMTDGCVDNDGMFYDLPSCTTAFMDGLLHRSGARAALSEYLQAILQALNDRTTQIGQVECTPVDTDAGAFTTMSQLGAIYLPPAFQRASAIIVSEGQQFLTDFSNGSIAVTLISLLALLVFYICVYAPLITSLDRDIKDCRGLLLLFPDEVAKNVPAIVRAGRQLLRDARK